MNQSDQGHDGVSADADTVGDWQDRTDRNGKDGIARKEMRTIGDGGRSHGATSSEPRDRGRFIAQVAAARFWAKVDKQPGGCWLWTGATTTDGYGRFRITIAPGRHRHVKAHRWAYEHLVGPIRAGYTLDHLAGTCTSKACVRPDHLEPVTRAENIRRAVTWRRLQRAERTP